MEIAARILLGASLGAALGFLLGRARVCSAESCNVKVNMTFSILGGAVFGAALAWYFISR